MEFERVKYLKCPLAEVIFQVRFPSILRISSEEPSDFQEKIRDAYPLFSVNNSETVVEIDGQKQVIGTTKNYQFVSEDGKSKINLTNAFIALSTLSYDRWEFFKDECKKVVNYFSEIYNPSIVQRVGLRYKDVIIRSQLGLNNTPWTDLINNKYLGILAVEDENKVNRFVLDYEYEEERPVLAHCHFELVRSNPTMNEISMLMDCDNSVNGIMKYDTVMDTSEKLHDSSSRFLRSSITDKLHFAMKPQKI